MSKPNFRIMREFPLYVLPDAVSPVCPECGEPMEEDECTCPACGYDGAPVLAFDPWETEYAHGQIRAMLDDLNAALTFFQVSLINGYYTGTQLYVEEPESSPVELENAVCRRIWDLCRSAAVRRRDSERRKICRWMEQAADAWNMAELICVECFSGGIGPIAKKRRIS